MSIPSALAAHQLFFILTVSRDNIVQDTLDKVVNIDDKSALKKPMKVKFEGEPGVDEGGVKKEFFQLLTQQLFDPQYGEMSHSTTGGRGSPPVFSYVCGGSGDSTIVV